ncbi:MAG: hypothetical protein IJH50_02280 [Kiritimatiellae bacterium]|nr:hypothetical protein [Kiritimatiellia bacterium]
MRGRPKKDRTEAERHDFRLESSRIAHAKRRREAWHKKHAAPSRTSSKPPPTLDELREAYRRRGESCEAMIRLGSMLGDVEAAYYVGYMFEKYDNSGTDASYFIDEVDAPWQTGIRGFLKGAPDLLAKYKTLMRYKKLSADFREAIELYDPNPASLVFDDVDETWLLPVRKKAMALLNGCDISFRELAKRIADFGQQPGLRPEPRHDAQYAHAMAKRGIGAVEGVRGMCPPVDVKVV